MNSTISENTNRDDRPLALFTTKARHKTAGFRHASGRCLATIVVGLALLVTGTIQPALARDLTPLVASAVDGNGVDMISGKFTFGVTEVAIGPQGAGGLAHSRSFRGDRTASLWRSSLSGTLRSNEDVNEEVVDVAVSFGGATVTFDVSGSTYTPRNDNGASLAKSGVIYTFTSSTGVIAKFSEDVPANDREAYIIEIIKPNGEVIKFHHNSATVGAQTGHRLQSVNNNFGYQIHFEYEIDTPTTVSQLEGGYLAIRKVVGINLAVDYCAPTANSCTGYQAGSPYVTYSKPNSTTERVTNALGQKVEYVYSPTDAEALIQIKRHSGLIATTITYQTGSNSSVKTVNAGNVTYTYTLSTSLGSGLYRRDVTAPNTGLVRYTYRLNWPGGVTEVRKYNNATAASGTSRWVSYTRNTEGRVTQTEDRDARKTVYDYDSRGNITRVTRQATGMTDIVTEAGYSSTCSNPVICNKPIWTEDAYGYRTHYTYNSIHGGIKNITAPRKNGAAPHGSGGSRPQVRHVYTLKKARYHDDTGTLVNGPSIYMLLNIKTCTSGNNRCAGEARETVVTNSYQASGSANNILLTSVKAKAGDNSVSSKVSTAWDGLARPVKVTDALGNVSNVKYDGLGRVKTASGPDPDGTTGPLKHPAMKTTYNNNGFVTRVQSGTMTSGTGWGSFAETRRAEIAYDRYGRQIKQTSKVAGVIQSVVEQNYDSAGRPQCFAFRMTPSTFTRAACVQQPGTTVDDRISYTTYTLFNEPEYVYTGWGTGNSRYDRRMSYLANGSLDWIKDGAGNKTKFEYDGFGRLYRTYYPHKTITGNHSTTDYVQNTYHTRGRLTSTRTRGGDTFTFTYDNLGRLITNNMGPERDISYAYDQAGRPIQVKYTNGDYTIDNAFDALGRLTSVTESGTKVTGANRLVTYTYNAAGQRTSIEHPDSKTLDYHYDTVGRMILVELGGVDLAAFRFDDRGRRTEADITSGTVTTHYTYEADSALDTLSHDLQNTANDVTLTYDYDAANSIISKDVSNNNYLWDPSTSGTEYYTANGLNQYSLVNGLTLSYDSKGNLTGDGTWSYTFDASNRMTAASRSGTRATYEYDPLGRRSAKVVNGNRTEFLHDGNEVIIEYFINNGSPQIDRRFVYGQGLDERLFVYAGAGTTDSDRTSFHTDHLGSTIVTADHNGTMVESFTYSPDGDVDDPSGNQYRYTGRYLDAETGLYYYRARYYRPDFGRFLSPDPIGYAAGMNLYSYVSNNPINFTDPLGLMQVRGFETSDCSGDSTLFESVSDASAAGFVATITGSGKCTLIEDEIIVRGTRTRIFAVPAQWFLPTPIHGGVSGFIPIGTGGVAASPPAQSGNNSGECSYSYQNPTGQGIRNDDAGQGYFGASRGGIKKAHPALDFLSTPGQAVRAPISGVYSHRYSQQQRHPFASIVNGPLTAEIFYIARGKGLEDGDYVTRGQVIGRALAVSNFYGHPAMKDHAHLQIRVLAGTPRAIRSPISGRYFLNPTGCIE